MCLQDLLHVLCSAFVDGFKIVAWRIQYFVEWDVSPVVYPPYQVPFPKKDSIKAEVDKMVNDQIIAWLPSQLIGYPVSIASLQNC